VYLTPLMKGALNTRGRKFGIGARGHKSLMMRLPDGRKSFKIGLVVLTGCGRQTPSQPRRRSKDCFYYVARVKCFKKKLKFGLLT